MKKAYTALALAFLLALSLCTPAMAAMEYGVIYDETESLGSQELTRQGEQTLPQLAQALGLELRVDVVTQNSYDAVSYTHLDVYKRQPTGRPIKPRYPLFAPPVLWVSVPRCCWTRMRVCLWSPPPEIGRRPIRMCCPSPM